MHFHVMKQLLLLVINFIRGSPRPPSPTIHQFSISGERKPSTSSFQPRASPFRSAQRLPQTLGSPGRAARGRVRWPAASGGRRRPALFFAAFGRRGNLRSKAEDERVNEKQIFSPIFLYQLKTRSLKILHLKKCFYVALLLFNVFFVFANSKNSPTF